MTSKPPTQSLFPENWDLDDDGEGATREVETDELFARAGIVSSVAAAPSGQGEPPPSRRPASPPPASSLPASASPATLPPPMPHQEYVEQMMRMAPQSDAGLLPLVSDPDEDFGSLTPWPASVPPDRDPSSLSNLLFETAPGALAAGRLPPGLEDLGASGSGSYGEVDMADLMPELVAPPRRASTAPPRGELDELDELLSDEVKRVIRSDTMIPGKGDAADASDMSPGSDFGLELSFDDPVFLPTGSGGSGLRAPSISFDAVNPMTIELEERSPAELPSVAPLPPKAEPLEEEETIELAPDTMVEATPFMFDREVQSRRDTSSMQSRLERLRARFEVGDFGGALVLAEGMLDEEPRYVAARCYADACRLLLRQMYMARMGDKTKILRVTLPPDQLKALTLDHRAGFLLSCVDGKSTLDEILDVSGMQALDALRILYELITQGVIEAEMPSSSRRK